MSYELKMLEKYYPFTCTVIGCRLNFVIKIIRKIKFKLKIQCYVNIKIRKNKKNENRKRNKMSWNVNI